MPLSAKAFQEKDDNLNAINHLLHRAKKGEPHMTDYQVPVLIEPCIYITIYTEVGDPVKWYKRGYVIDIDIEHHRAVGARYFIAEGKDTYTEVVLDSKQFKDLILYYKINEMDLFGMCHKKVSVL